MKIFAKSFGDIKKSSTFVSASDKEHKNKFVAGVLKLVDNPDLGSGAERRGGSSPFARTQKEDEKLHPLFLFYLNSILPRMGKLASLQLYEDYPD